MDKKDLAADLRGSSLIKKKTAGKQARRHLSRETGSGSNTTKPKSTVRICMKYV
jgi:hypothetical protein